MSSKLLYVLGGAGIGACKGGFLGLICAEVFGRVVRGSPTGGSQSYEAGLEIFSFFTGLAMVTGGMLVGAAGGGMRRLSLLYRVAPSANHVASTTFSSAAAAYKWFSVNKPPPPR